MPKKFISIGRGFKLKSRDSASLTPLEAYVVFEGRVKGAFPDARGAYNSIQGVDKAVCYRFSSLDEAVSAFIAKHTVCATEVTEEELHRIIIKPLEP